MSESIDEAYRPPQTDTKQERGPLATGTSLLVSPGGSIALAVISFLIVLVLFFAGQLLQLLNVPIGLMATSLLIFGAAGLIFPAVLNLRIGAFTGLSRAPGFYPVMAILIGVANLPFANFLMGAMREVLPKSLSEQGDELTKLLIQADHPARIALVIAAGIAAPLGEEAFFRGWLLGVLSLRYRRWLAVLVVATVFSLIHFEWAGFIARVELGVLFGIARVWTGSLWPAVAMHATHNILSTMILYWDPNPLAALEAPFDWKAEIPLAAGSLVATLVLVAIFRAATKRVEEPEPWTIPDEDRQPLRVNLRCFLRFALPNGALLIASVVALAVLADHLPGAALTEKIRQQLFGSAKPASTPPDAPHPQDGGGHLK